MTGSSMEGGFPSEGAEPVRASAYRLSRGTVGFLLGLILPCSEGFAGRLRPWDSLGGQEIEVVLDHFPSPPAPLAPLPSRCSEQSVGLKPAACCNQERHRHEVGVQLF